ncbi:stage VI sporulation protein D [Halobacillus locisalis]|uniref:Stage VI sporulation protein D n=1 Tax=Halobacillus locisalis TaxID=220753 RepID=A0A838CN08_9BACI|nr:stage VI sporulation protein D [Halobacillus locisalis]MBA2173430.1 stage VI sporulation protein D [Halobacillus locisalis]
MQNQQNVFSFYLDESLWFKEGQGVRELIGISLEPEITIEEAGDEVRLKGTVELAGEYVAAEDHDDESPHSSARVVNHVETGEDGEYHFSHSFPVEVTVPLDRVSSLDDVLVDIESFDYEIPATNRLRLHAQVNINGIQPQEQQATNDEAFDEPATVGPFNFPEEKEKESPVLPEREAPVIQLNDEQEAKEEESGRWLYKKSQSFPEFFGQEQQQDYVEEVSSESISMDVSVSKEESSSYVEEPSSSSSSEKEAPSGMDGIKQIFKHLFPNREDTYTQMKMYIAQEEETLASIADKYGVSVKQLERVNEYEEEDVSPGQIVYIPN